MKQQQQQNSEQRLQTLTCNASRAEINDKSHQIDRELKLNKLLDIRVDWANPFGNDHNSLKFVVQDYYVGTLLGHLIAQGEKFNFFSWNTVEYYSESKEPLSILAVFTKPQ